MPEDFRMLKQWIALASLVHRFVSAFCADGFAAGSPGSQ